MPTNFDAYLTVFVDNILTIKDDFARRYLAALRHHAEHGKNGHCFATTRFTYQTDGFSFLYVETHIFYERCFRLAGRQ